MSTTYEVNERKVGDWVRQALNEKGCWMLIIHGTGVTDFTFAEWFRAEQYQDCLKRVGQLLDPTSQEGLVTVCDLTKLTLNKAGIDALGLQHINIERDVNELQAAYGKVTREIQVGEG